MISKFDLIYIIATSRMFLSFAITLESLIPLWLGNYDQPLLPRLKISSNNQTVCYLGPFFIDYKCIRNKILLTKSTANENVPYINYTCNTN